MKARKKPTLLIENIGLCLTMDPAVGEGPMGVVKDAVVVLAGEKIRWVGPKSKLRKEYRKTRNLNAKGALVTPGLVDCHTHLLFSGSRADEFFARLQGRTYEEIAREGGGIKKTARMTRETGDAELLRLTRKRLDRFLAFGVTTAEVKSGYGLLPEEELRGLRLISKLDHPVDTRPTLLAAHSMPLEFAGRREEFLEHVCQETIPTAAKQKLASVCDVFCDEGAFSVPECEQVLKTAVRHGMSVKLHADQFASIGAGELAASLGALSADHLEQSTDETFHAFAKRGVVGVLLPGAVFSLGKRTYPRARAMLDAGMRIAISTDCNPGTSYSENLPLMMSLAALELRLTAEEIWPAVTKNAARAMGLTDRGELRVGRRADLVLWDAESAEDVIYHYGASFPSCVLTSGKVHR